MKWVAAAGLALMLCAAAFVGGWATGRIAPRPASDFYGTPIAPAPANWSEWRYPNAQDAGQSSAGGTNYGSLRVGMVQVAHLVTQDGYDQVMGYYATKLGQPGLASPAGMGAGNAIRGVPGGQEFAAYADLPQSRPGLKARVFTYRTTNYALTLTVSRVEADKTTHIAIAYLLVP